MASLGDVNLHLLDAQFLNQMNQLADERHQDEELQLQLEDKLRPSHWRQLMSRLQFSGHLGRLFLRLLGQLSMVDVYGGRQAGGRHGHASGSPSRSHAMYQEQNISTTSLRGLNFDLRYSSVEPPYWPFRIARFLYCISALSLAINSLFQYPFDWHFFRQQAFRAIVHPGTQTIDVSYQIQAYSGTPFMRTVRLLHENVERQKRCGLRCAATANGSSSSLADASERLARFERRLDERVQMFANYLSLVGAPYMTMHFLIEIIYYFLITSAVYVQDLLHLYFKYITPFDFSLLRAILDWRHERRLVNKLIVSEVNRFIGSSRNFILMRRKVAELCIRDFRLGQSLIESKETSKRDELSKQTRKLIGAAKNELSCRLMDHWTSCSLIRQMALDGTLMPCSRELMWIRKLNEYIIITCIVFMIYTYLAALIFAFGFFSFTQYNIKISLVDVSVIVEAGVLVLIMVAVGSFYISILSANCTDQLRLIRSTKKNILDCISKNENHFIRCQRLRRNLRYLNETKKSTLPPHSKAPVSSQRNANNNFSHYYHHQVVNESLTRSEWLAKKQSLVVMIDSQYRQINRNLLEAFMNYKIFIAQMRPITKSFGPFTFGCLLIMFTLPLSLRLHVTYLDHNFKLYAMCFCIVLSSVADLALVPLCHMYARCRNVHKCLSSLLAHALEMGAAAELGLQRLGLSEIQRATSKIETDEGLEGHDQLDDYAQEPPVFRSKAQYIYDLHVIWLLRKELNHPELMEDRFSIYTFGVRLTYANLLRVHFWVSLLSLSMVVQSTTMVDVDPAMQAAQPGPTTLGLGRASGLPQQELFSRLLSDPFRVFT